MTQETAPSSSRALKMMEDVGANPTTNATIGDLIAARLSRRDLGRGLLAATALAATPSLLAQPAQATDAAVMTFAFDEAAAGSDATHHVAAGYDADVLIRWGDAVLSDAPAFDPQAQSPAAQSRQFGFNNDFLGFFPIDGRNDRGLLVVNHEYTAAEMMFASLGGLSKEARFEAMTADRVGVEMMAHGGSVIEIERVDGRWRIVPNSRYARRITAETKMRISGPAAGHGRMKTAADATGAFVNGMLNNCAGATTPWGTWLTCEENFNGYFWNKAALGAHPDAAALKRYGAPAEWYPWAKFHDRFDIAKEPNEPHRFGWVVEIDPFDPTSTPVKRTALGRFKHEGAGNIVNKDGRFVVYQGDDERFDYVYKFVTRAAVDRANPTANKDILDDGTLYVARFNADGSGLWLPLVHGEGPLFAANGFADQGDVVIFARQAADLLGATRMDRPEDVEANPKTNSVYVMLTNNNKRKDGDIDAANPRADNKFGHIIEIKPDGGDHGCAAFTWNILLRCGDPAIAAVGATFNPLTTKDGWFGMPDNCAIDALGRLWVSTDGNSAGKTGRTDGVWAIETEGTARGTSKLFFRTPVGAEMCGPCFTPDMETFFVAVQHPGESDDEDKNMPPASFDAPTTRWPDFKEGMPPRPSVVAITRKGGGKIAV
ncbi:MAG: PhoX family protein [Hyphomicrobium sp.]